jgi:tripartite-type tricarboxylate transporter receptor subunit TctC
MKSRHCLLRAAAAFALAAFANVALAQYPNKPIRMLVGFAAGTGPDVAARIVAQQLQDSIKSAVVVENRPGAAGFIAAQEAARAHPDGYTLLFGEVGQLSMAPSTYKSVPYDPAKDFAPVSQVVSADFVLVVGASAPPKDLKEYVDWVKSRKDYFMATFGAGTPGHFGAVMLGDDLKLKVEPVHYRTTADAMTGTISGDTQGMFGTAALVTPHVRGGRLRAIAVTGPVHSPLLPDVPTFPELGHPDLQFSAWFGLVAPAKAPPEVIDKLNAEVTKALASGEGRKKLEEAGFRVTPSTPAEFGKYIAEERERWAKVVKQSGFKALE